MYLSRRLQTFILPILLSKKQQCMRMPIFGKIDLLFAFLCLPVRLSIFPHIFHLFAFLLFLDLFFFSWVLLLIKFLEFFRGVNPLSDVLQVFSSSLSFVFCHTEILNVYVTQSINSFLYGFVQGFRVYKTFSHLILIIYLR